MYLHFEDWSDRLYLDLLERKGLPHGGKIIKIFANDEDPRIALAKPDLAIVKSNHAPIGESEVYDYAERGLYSGPELEAVLANHGLNDIGERIVRSLFRFANEQGFTQAAMAARKGDSWLINHPLGDIDGIDMAIRNPARIPHIHLDIFFPDSLARLKESVVDYDDPSQLLDKHEASRWRTGSSSY